MSTTESAASLPSASSTTSSCAASVEDDELDVIRADAMRDNLRGMEAELVDLVLETSSAWQWMDWLRVPLECATATGSLRVVKHLLSIGVETGSPPRRSRPRPLLHAAASNGNAEIVEELVKAGADVHEVDRNHNDRTALHCAAASGADAAVRALSSAGAFVDTADTRGWTPLHLAAKMGHRGVVVFLLLKGANALGATVPEGDSPLHLAANNNHAGVIEDMLALGNACVGCCNAHGQTGTTAVYGIVVHGCDEWNVRECAAGNIEGMIECMMRCREMLSVDARSPVPYIDCLTRVLCAPPAAPAAVENVPWSPSQGWGTVKRPAFVCPPHLTRRRRTLSRGHRPTLAIHATQQMSTQMT